MQLLSITIFILFFIPEILSQKQNINKPAVSKKNEGNKKLNSYGRSVKGGSYGQVKGSVKTAKGGGNGPGKFSLGK